MPKENPKSSVQRIIEINQRRKFSFGKETALVQVAGLRSAHSSMPPNQSVLLRYFPIALISCVEVFFKSAIKQLIDHGEPYLSNAQKLVEKSHYDFDVLTSLHGQVITVGDLISHHIRINNLANAISLMSEVMGEKFRDKVATAVDRWEVEIKDKEPAPIISDIDVTFKHVGETFRLRHIFCHEVAHEITMTDEEISNLIAHVSSFLQASSSLIDDTLYPDAPLTQMDMNIATADEYGKEREKLHTLIEETIQILSEKQKEKFEMANASWNRFLDASVELEGLEFEGGSMRPAIENVASTRLTKERQAQIRNLIEFKSVV